MNTIVSRLIVFSAIAKEVLVGGVSIIGAGIWGVGVGIVADGFCGWGLGVTAAGFSWRAAGVEVGLLELDCGLSEIGREDDSGFWSGNCITMVIITPKTNKIRPDAKVKATVRCIDFYFESSITVTVLDWKLVMYI